MPVITTDENTAELLEESEVEIVKAAESNVRQEILNHILADEPVVGIYNNAYTDYINMYRLIKSRGGNPYLYEPISTNHLVSLPPDLSKTLPEAKLLGMQETKPWKLQFRVTTSKTVSRRTLLLKPLSAIREYRAHPVIVDYNACSETVKCTLCIENCPERALIGKPPEVDPLKCTECGLCASICPSKALTMPSWGPGKTSVVLGKIRERYSGPLTMLVLERNDLPVIARVETSPGKPPFIVEAVDSMDWLDARIIMDVLTYGVSVAIYDRDGRVYDDIRRIAHVASSLQELRDILWMHSDLGVDPGNYGLVMEELGLNRIESKTPILGIVKVSENCTLCDACVSNCPTGALRKSVEGDRVMLQFHHDKCTGCRVCESVCPHSAIHVEWGVDREMYGRTVTLIQDELVRCRNCGKPLGAKSMFQDIEKRLRARGVPEEAIKAIYLCDECKMKSFRRI